MVVLLCGYGGIRVGIQRMGNLNWGLYEIRAQYKSELLLKPKRRPCKFLQVLQ